MVRWLTHFPALEISARIRKYWFPKPNSRSCAMDRETASARTLRRALQSAGSLEHLATLLEVDADDLERWVSGTELPPHGVFLRALELAMRTSSQPAKYPARKGDGGAIGADEEADRS
jgi:hypothetical protein